MKFYSTKDRTVQVSFEEAVRLGLARDGGLFMPDSIDLLPKTFWPGIAGKSFKQLSYEVASHFLKGALPENDLRKLIDSSVSIETPLVEVEENIFALELFHGPTLAFKDFGAKFLSALLGYFARDNDSAITVLVATSGDTGGAVANGFFQVPNTRVVILYPSGKVSGIQEKQFTTLGNNITALEVNGTFDDCQLLVKQAFADQALCKELSLTSANSINIARLLPQSFYYFNAFAQLKDKDQPLVFSVPSGNFGNLTAGLMAKRMGLPVRQFIAATNLNDVVPEYLRTEKFSPRPSIQTISNAMDVGNPSNFARIMDLYQNDFDSISKDITGFHFSDQVTTDIIRQVFNSVGYLLDPHGAIGYLGLKEYLKESGRVTGIFLETAHPGKFKNVVEEALGKSITLPGGLEKFMKGEKKSIALDNSFENFRAYLIDHLS